MNKFLTFQQSELDAVLMYQKLIEEAESDSEKNILKALKADEGKHAATLAKITNRHDLTPTDTMAKPVVLLRKHAGAAFTYSILGFGEKMAYFLYQPLTKAQPILQTVAADERRHGSALFSMAKEIVADAKIFRDFIKA